MKSIERMEIEVVIGLWIGDGELNELVVTIKINYGCCSINKLGNLNLNLQSSK